MKWRAIDESPDDSSLRHRMALALVLAGDREEYRRACTATLEQFDRSDDALMAESIRSCLIPSGAVEDPSLPPSFSPPSLPGTQKGT
jgi:hypothetical protein